MYIFVLSAWLGPFKMCIIGFKYNKFEAATYGALSPIFWGAGVSWVIYCVERGCGGKYIDNTMELVSFYSVL